MLRTDPTESKSVTDDYPSESKTDVKALLSKRYEEMLKKGYPSDNSFKVPLNNVERAAISGGGAGGLGFAVALFLLGEAGLDFSKLKGAIGSSVGAVAALAICLKLTPLEMFKRLALIDFSKVKDLGKYHQIPKRLFKQQRLYEGEVIFQHVLKFLRDITGREDAENITFEDLKKLGYDADLSIVLTELLNIDGRDYTGGKIIFSYETTPRAPIAWAIRASTAAPPYFPGVGFKIDRETGQYIVIKPGEPFDKEARYFVDGGVSDNYPLKAYDFAKYLSQSNEAPSSSAAIPIENELNRDDKSATEIRRYENPMRPIEESWSEEDKARTKPVVNPNVIGMALHWPLNTPVESLKPGNPLADTKAFINTLMSNSYNELMGQEENYYRTVKVKRVIGLTDFNIDAEKRLEVMRVAAESVCDYLEMNEEETEAVYQHFLENCYYQFFPRPEEIAKQAAEKAKERALFSQLSENFLMFGAPLYTQSPETPTETEKASSNCVCM